MSEEITNATILLVEDHNDLAATIGAYLEDSGYAMDYAADGSIALNLMEDNLYDVIILDLMMPKVNGIRVCTRLRERGDSTPILMLTARAGESDRVTGLELGADDYLTKPFSLRELTARVRSLLRRVRWERGTPEGVYADSRLEVDPARMLVRVAGGEVHLTRREFAILWHLISLGGRVVAREQILDAVWGLATIVEPRTVDAHIRTLRRKIGDDVIETLIGAGYRFRSRP